MAKKVISMTTPECYVIDGEKYILKEKLTIKQFGELIKLFPKELLSGNQEIEIDIAKVFEVDFSKVGGLIFSKIEENDKLMPADICIDDLPEVLRGFGDFFKKKENIFKAVGEQLKR